MVKVWKPGGKGGGGRYLSYYDGEDVQRAFRVGQRAGELRALDTISPPEFTVALPEEKAYQHVGEVQNFSGSLIAGIVLIIALLIFALWGIQFLAGVYK